jgi:hypothetical protein
MWAYQGRSADPVMGTNGQARKETTEFSDPAQNDRGRSLLFEVGLVLKFDKTGNLKPRFFLFLKSFR